MTSVMGERVPHLSFFCSEESASGGRRGIPAGDCSQCRIKTTHLTTNRTDVVVGAERARRQGSTPGTAALRDSDACLTPDT